MNPVDWPAIVKRYAYAPDVLSERPWWRDPHAPRPEVPAIEYPPPPWVEITSGSGDNAGLRSSDRDSRYPRRPYVRTDGAIVYVDANAGRDDVLDAYDCAQPIPEPLPACGQVWVWSPEEQATVVDIRGGKPVWNSGCPPGPYKQSAQKRANARVQTHKEEVGGFLCVGFGTPVDSDYAWPPPGAALVAGPGAPWMDNRSKG